MATDEFQYSEEVAHALANRLPIVALESTIISHGMPYPENVQTARAVEDIIRRQHAVPATIAILHGKVHIGLDEAALETLGKVGRACMKCSRKDLPMALAQKLHGATTVAATMYLAHRAGLKHVAHEVAQGTISALRGGDFTSGFVSGYPHYV